MTRRLLWLAGHLNGTRPEAMCGPLPGARLHGACPRAASTCRKCSLKRYLSFQGTFWLVRAQSTPSPIWKGDGALRACRPLCKRPSAPAHWRDEMCRHPTSTCLEWLASGHSRSAASQVSSDHSLCDLKN